MKRISKWLTPVFLTKLDGYLLDHYPEIWRTRGHFVLFYTLIITFLLFIAGYFFPVSVNDLMVHPICPIVIQKENYFYLSLIFAFIGILYWANTQHQIRMSHYNSIRVFRTIIVYMICLFFIIGIACSAFRMGTIIRSTHLIEQDDLSVLKSGNYYPYGFLLLPGDTIYTSPNDSFYKDRTLKFLDIYKHEQRILKKRYDNSHIHKLVIGVDYKLEDMKSRTYLAERIYLAELSNLSTLWDYSEDIELEDLSYLYGLSYQSFRSSLSFLSELSHPKSLSELSKTSFRSYRSELSKRSLSELSDLRYQVLLSNYYNYVKKTRFYEEDSLLNKYYFKNDTIHTYIGEISIPLPKLPYLIEDSIRSTEHAQLFLKEGHFLGFLKILCYHLLFICFFIFTIPYYSYKRIVATLFLFIVLIWIGDKGELSKIESLNWITWSYILIPILSFILILRSAYLKQFDKITDIAFHIFAISVLYTLFFAFPSFNEMFQAPSNFAFFFVQGLAVIVMFLMAYISTLPKKV